MHIAGKVAWLSSLYLAALRAGEEMAREMGDDAFARQCRTLVEQGRRNVDAKLFNGEYYVQVPDPARRKTVGSYDGCEIDQVFGDSWSTQLGLGPILDPKNVRSALGALWKYNFTPDVGPYRAAYKPGRWYAMPGEGGLLMCSWPRGEAQRVTESYDFYFNECMNGFEYQVAWHMIGAGLVQEGLAITRMIHDRYHASRRNPWNEVECGDHYSRSMASFGVFLRACGFDYHGPKGHLGFAPKLTPENFKCPFTTAEGWGSYAQESQISDFKSQISLQWGRLRLRTVALEVRQGFTPVQVTATIAGKTVPATLALEGNKAAIRFEPELVLISGQAVQITLGPRPKA